MNLQDLKYQLISKFGTNYVFHAINNLNINISE
jgi:hypothetical protein